MVLRNLPYAALNFCQKLTRPSMICPKRTSMVGDHGQGSPPKQKEKLILKLGVEVRGHDKAILNSYSSFVRNVCKNLEIECGKIVAPKYVRWVQMALRSKFAKKKYKVHYETRTYIQQIPIYHITGSTADTFLEYIQRNIPEGVAMKVTKEEIIPLPDTLKTVESKPEIDS